ncbi:type I restriction and modification enzyme subunit R-like protein [Balneicella halophila]|uniref:Type I restriction and modification enzyme subunit R-like protein n=1 Tax=Balneicella halophila TaxID=1537566 RepID=A0A7L4UPG6_BALHA|nr:type I restriction enzyme HsdR N-terminal domain-containing protein [Balneicella halophila]PVX50777.1 type I restriction and modification enzyme subunit R-like protein [Balneicella halophila]
MTPLQLPTYPFRLKKEDNIIKIFDIIRKKFIVLQPEEWVRQHWVHYLIQEKEIPASLLAVEISVNTKLLKQRSDIVAFDNNGKPLLIVECKAPSIKLSQSAFDQIARYNMKLKVPYLVVSNGLQHFCCKIDYEKKSYDFIKNIPEFSFLKAH